MSAAGEAGSSTARSSAAGSSILRIGMVGHAFMGRAHTYGWRNAARVFASPLEPRLMALAGTDAGRAASASRQLGWERSESDWRRLVDSPDIDLIDICAPGDLHHDITVAALEAGKHVLCEKPLANSAAQARSMVRAARAVAPRGVRAMCGFTYRHQPALAQAKRMLDEGRLGAVRHVRVQYLQDWLSDETAPYSWRLDAARAGSGALGDLGAHAVDLMIWLTGTAVLSVSAMLDTFVRERPLPDAAPGSDGLGRVSVDDAATILARLEGGATGTIEVTRVAAGRKNALRVEINGSRGSIAFDLERNNELEYYSVDDDPLMSGFRRVLVTEPGHPTLEGWWPPGHMLGYDHGFVNQAAALLRSIAVGEQPEPSFDDALGVQLVLEAAAESSRTERWVPVPSSGDGS